MELHKLVLAVEKHTEKMEKAQDYFWTNPETGYREWKAHAYLTSAFRELGYELTEAGNIPGFYTDLDTGRPGPKVLVMGEMDSLLCATHPEADPETGAVHSCGHCCQIAALLGLAAALKEPGVLEDLCGSIRLMAVPAEELIEVEYREQLRQQGIIRYYGGKVEFMHRGFMDGVDMALMIHTANLPAGTVTVDVGSNGCISKEMIFRGVAAHAGASPHKGVNALYAANLALSAINALRETFREGDHIRVHPIMTHGGTAVNAIPDYVRLESYVRGANLDAIKSANDRINLALAGAAAALGAKVELHDRPGYSPVAHDRGMMELARDAIGELMTVQYCQQEWDTGCSDMGDVTMVLPAVQPYIAGASGRGHGNDYYITDRGSALTGSAKAQANMLVKLLEKNGSRAWEIKRNFKPTFASIQEYFAYVDQLFMDRQAVEYAPDGTVTLRVRP